MCRQAGRQAGSGGTWSSGKFKLRIAGKMVRWWGGSLIWGHDNMGLQVSREQSGVPPTAKKANKQMSFASSWFIVLNVHLWVTASSGSVSKRFQLLSVSKARDVNPAFARCMVPVPYLFLERD